MRKEKECVDDRNKKRPSKRGREGEDRYGPQ